MKSLIAPIAIIASLIILFVIIDQKDYIPFDDVQQVQTRQGIHRRATAFATVSDTQLLNMAKQAIEKNTERQQRREEKRREEKRREEKQRYKIFSHRAPCRNNSKN